MAYVPLDAEYDGIITVLKCVKLTYLLMFTCFGQPACADWEAVYLASPNFVRALWSQ